MAESADGEFDLRTLDDAELTEQVHDDLYNGLKAEVEEATRIFLERGWSPERVLNDGLVEGMRIVGVDFRDGILFVPEVLQAATIAGAVGGDLRHLLTADVGSLLQLRHAFDHLVPDFLGAELADDLLRARLDQLILAVRLQRVLKTQWIRRVLIPHRPIKNRML